MRPSLLALPLSFALAACAPTQAPGTAAPTASSGAAAPVAFDEDAAARRIRADVEMLADDLMEGREAGTRGYDLAALYVATQYRLMGLAPAGEDGSYFQEVPLLRGVRERDGARFAITREGKTTELQFESEYLPLVHYTEGATEVTAPLVFVSQAVHAPELGHDDFAGIDVKGKIAVLLSNAPKRFANDQRAFYSSFAEKSRALVARGAVGAIALGNPVDEKKRPWALDSPNWRRPGMRVLDAAGKPIDDFPELRGRAALNVAQAALLFQGAGHTADDVFAMLEQDALKSFDLAGTATLATRATLERVKSRNVVGKLAGSDAVLANEHIAFTAHLDHVGIGAAKDGDTIYNGAQDNALGVAIMVEAARGLIAGTQKPKRSLLFIALTAEEKGLLGAYYFAANPTVPRASLVANVNMDMPVLMTDLTDVIPVGIEHSTLEGPAQRAVAEAGLTLTPDPIPEEVVFVRSDQYPFIRAGIPAIYLIGGIKPRDGSDGLKLLTQFLGQHYHLPSDEVALIHWPSAARLARVNERIGLAIADEAARPAWKTGDFFGQKFGAP